MATAMNSMQAFSHRDIRDPNKFAYLELTPTTVGGKPTWRLMITLKTVGCSHSAKGGCAHCALGANSFQGITSVNLKNQIDSVFHYLRERNIPTNQIGLVDLLTNGSFLDPKEVPVDARAVMVSKIAFAFPGCRKVVIDTRPEYVTRQSVQPLADILKNNGKKLEVSLGVDTSGWINRLIVNKGYGFREVRKAFEVLATCGADLMGYVLIKTPGQNEREAIKTAVATGRKLLKIGNKLKPNDPKGVSVAVEPIFVGGNTPLAELYKQGKYEPPHLFSAAKVADEIKATSPGNDVYIGLSSEGIADKPEKEPNNRTSTGFDKQSSANARRLLTRFNAEQDISLLQQVLNENSDARLFWQNTLEREGRKSPILYYLSKFVTLWKVRQWKRKNPRQQFPFAPSKAGRQPISVISCARAIKTHIPR